MNVKAKRTAASCAFCTRLGVSKEHFWPDWMGDLFPPDLSSDYHVQLLHTMYSPAQGVMVIRPDIQVKRGHAGSRKVRKVCKTCNNGWMSEIEDQAAPVLRALIVGEKLDLEQAEVRAVAAWLALRSIVGEFTDPPMMAIPERERLFMWHRRAPPLAGWTMFIGRSAGEPDRHYHHGGLAIGRRSDTPAAQCNFQLTAIWLRKIVLFAASTATDVMLPVIEAMGDPRLIRIWPTTPARLVLTAVPELTQKEADELAFSLLGQLNSLEMAG